jgi:hypothetical protein
MATDKKQGLNTERPDSVKLLEAEGFVWDPRRTSFVKVREGGQESVISYENVYDWSLEDLKVLASTHPAHPVPDIKKGPGSFDCGT